MNPTPSGNTLPGEDDPGHPDLPGVSVVVPVHTGQDVRADCIESLLALDYPPDRLEILIVDNASTDRTAEIIERFPVRRLREERRGACCARNAGIRNAKHELIAFTDADCLPDPAWLRDLTPHFRDPKVAGCGGPLVAHEPRTVIEQYIVHHLLLSHERAHGDYYISPPFLITANAVYRKSVLDEVGGFDESFAVAGEDADLSWRIRHRYHLVVCSPDGAVRHRHRSNLRGLLRQVRAYGEGSSRLFARHYKRFGMSKVIEWQPWYGIPKSIARMPFALIFGRGRLGRLMPFLDFLCHIAFLSGKVPASRRLGVKYY